MLDTVGTLCFGPFRLLPNEKTLLECNRPVRLGSRALNILIGLVERAGEVVSKDELIARAWPNTYVEEANLRVHLSAIRKVLGDGVGGVQYIVNVPGRGYSFVAAIDHREASGGSSRPAQLVELPARLARMVGRDDILDRLSKMLSIRRLLTIVGSGGVGKTTTAVALAEAIDGNYPDGARFVDLASISEASLVPSALAAAVGVAVPVKGPLPNLVAFLRPKQLLIVLDNCEHLIEPVAELVEAIYIGARNVHLLATSREPLRVEGEYVHRLTGLGCPEHNLPYTPAEALTFSAVQLFVERAGMHHEAFQFRQPDVPVVCEICRRLDGMPLAIELAAARVDMFPLVELASRLDDRFALLTGGKRTAIARHQTLWATLDWSYSLLTTTEQTVLRRLSVFRASFDLDSAAGCCALDDLEPSTVVASVISLASKSLLTVDASGDVTLFRLLDSTRIFAQERLLATVDATKLNRSHAKLMLRILCAAAETWRKMSPQKWRATYARLTDDMRAAIDWAFGPGDDASLGCELTNAFGPLAYVLSLIEEMRSRYQLALDKIPGAAVRPVIEMQINFVLASVTCASRGPSPEVTQQFAHGAELAEQIGDEAHRIETHAGLWVSAHAAADYPASEQMACQLREAATRAGDQASALFADRMMAITAHHLGQHQKARQLAQRALDAPQTLIRLSANAPLQIDRKITMRAVFARSLWLEGHIDPAIDLIRSVTERALGFDHALPLCYALSLAAFPIAFWIGDLQQARELAHLLEVHAIRHSTYYYTLWAKAYRSVLALVDRDRGNGSTQPFDDRPSQDPRIIEMLCTMHPSFITPVDVKRADARGGAWCAAEVLRAHAEMAHSQGRPREYVEGVFHRSLQIAREQGARSWELRTSTSLARLLSEHGSRERAREVLAPVYEKFGSSHQTSDLQAAATFLKQLD
jgi:predicted ATPase/DNA-binding winged helix-turn-helix (wHTH) protein